MARDVNTIWKKILDGRSFFFGLAYTTSIIENTHLF